MPARVMAACWVAFAVSIALGSEHPGNIHVLGEDVRVIVPATWRDGRAELGKLPVGYYEVRETDGMGPVTAGVVAKSAPVPGTPIALDTAMAWFYPDPEVIRDACRLCRLAGVEWVRDRASWPELETARGTWAPEDTRYERAMRIERE